eukprot:CAMPEP_0116870460 /NCGR_PEP_ID=MMETSP0463-20121206/373_1 /TAXON_ID=181622 /ORGANISM="Strombidinopsis sp, Strain SopsisLIS2011" /LENGTH=171 /DNA_ID=CAMNT_0004507029 /DNA_START=882 /DNA_END=1397 /DNA_ORIENTATION=+
MKFQRGDPIYQQGDFAENIYIVHQGEVKMYAVNGFPYHTYKIGDVFGDADCFLNEPRDSKAAAAIPCILYSINFDKLNELLVQFPEQKSKMLANAKKANSMHRKKMMQVEKKNPIYGIANIQDDKIIGKLKDFGFHKLNDAMSRNLVKKDLSSAVRAMIIKNMNENSQKTT